MIEAKISPLLFFFAKKRELDNAHPALNTKGKNGNGKKRKSAGSPPYTYMITYSFIKVNTKSAHFDKIYTRKKFYEFVQNDD